MEPDHPIVILRLAFLFLCGTAGIGRVSEEVVGDRADEPRSGVGQVTFVVAELAEFTVWPSREMAPRRGRTIHPMAEIN
jgi:hypothetical protein